MLIGLFAAAPRPAAALENWPPLLNCSDVNADGHVDGFDIGAVVVKFGTFYPSEDYLLLYDVWGGGSIDGFDIGKVVGDFGLICPIVDIQVARATLAVIKYRDPLVALEDGYIQWSQLIPSMGVHLVNSSRITDFQPQITNPAGLLYTANGQLVAVYYLVPTSELCSDLGIEGVCSDLEPVGFGIEDDEDNIDANSFQTAWHTHPGLCSWDLGTEAATLEESTDETVCTNSGGFWHERYGWMVHLYNFIPNPAGRFLSWNTNVP